MTRLADTVRMERVRVSTLRSTYVLLGLAVVASAVIALMIAALAPPGQLAPSRTSAALTAGGGAMPVSTVGVLLAVLAVTTIGHDYRFGLLPVVLAVQPRRVALVAGRLVVLAVLAAGTALAVSLVSAGVCWALGRPPAHDAVTLRVTVFHAGVCVLWTWLGAGLAWSLRNPAGPLGLLLLVPLLVEPFLVVVAEMSDLPGPRAATRWLPFVAAQQALARSLGPGRDGIGALAGVTVFTGVSAIALATGVALVLRRDA